MPPLPETWTESHAVLKSLQDKGVVAIRASRLPRKHRERLLRLGLISEVMKGWYVPARPEEPGGESTSWYASYWDFCAGYLNERFGEEWCLGAEQSIRLHRDNWTIPQQLLVRSPRGGNKPIQLPHGTCILDVRLELPPGGDIEVKNGLRIMKLAPALIGCAPSEFREHTTDVRTALSMLPDSTELLRHLVAGGHTIVAGRLAGAFRSVGRGPIADHILQTMRTAGYTVYETDPFIHRDSVRG